MTTLAIVVPCYNEQEVLPETTRQLIALLQRLVAAGKIDQHSRIYLVDDGSSDGTWNLIKAGVADGSPVVGIKLSRNQGHQNALLAGLFSAAGDAVISIDADLQDDCNAIEAMLDDFHRGSDIVYGVRSSRQTDAFLKRLSAEFFYRLIARMGVRTIHNHADFRLLSRRVLEALKGYSEANLYLRGIIPLIGYKSSTVEYKRAARLAGTSKYPFRKMLSLALNAVTSFSVLPLHVISVLGVLVSAGTLIVSVWVLWVALFTDRAVPGWASTVLPIYFLGGVQLLSLGVIGEYMGKLYIESKQRPRYFIERIVGSDSLG
jgi:glycosyltransferase involved in cell wall biosynthesis